jgi:16S rRNA (guanine(966)-N(2))-methyltransferase RsmD
VRKALFDILGDIEGLFFLDLFAGSASVGFEAASRGIAELALVEDNRICQAAITKNIELLDVKMCSLYPQDVFKAVEMLYKNQKKFDIVFLDPPYYKDRVSRHRLVSKESFGESLAKKTLQMLEAYDIVAPNAFIVVEHFKKDVLPDNMAILSMFKQAKYGDTLLSFYKKKE